MTINGPAAVVWAFYIAAAENRGIPRSALGGTTQNDILKEYIAQNTFIYPPEPSMRLVVDTIEFAAKEMPRWNPVSISRLPHPRGRLHGRAGAGLHPGRRPHLCRVGRRQRGLDVDDFAPRLSFFFNAHNDFFEEIAKYRAARRIWARELKERFGAKNPRSLWLRFHTQTAGCIAHRPAARDQHRPHDHPGAGGRARRHAVAAHQLHGRGARPALRQSRAHRPAHAADHRRRDRRDQHCRSARRLVLRGGPHQRDGAPSATTTSTGSRSSAA